MGMPKIIYLGCFVLLLTILVGAADTNETTTTSTSSATSSAVSSATSSATSAASSAASAASSAASAASAASSSTATAASAAAASTASAASSAASSAATAASSAASSAATASSSSASSAASSAASANAEAASEAASKAAAAAAAAAAASGTQNSTNLPSPPKDLYTPPPSKPTTSPPTPPSPAPEMATTTSTPPPSISPESSQTTPPQSPPPTASTPATTPPQSPAPTTSTPTPPSSNIGSRNKCKCKNKAYTQCYNQVQLCPASCPNSCEVDCAICKPVCSCDYPGAVCQDPRFIGGDGVTFYFHGKKDKDFCLVTDPNLHINAHFIGKRKATMGRDFTWIQSIGILFDNHNIFLGASKTSTWDDSNDRLAITLDGEPIILDESQGSRWSASSNSMPQVTITRTSATNSIIVEIQGKLKITAKVVPITKEDSRVHNYGITSEDCFAHLDLGFKFYSLSGRVDGVLGKTYRDDYVTRVNVGAAMPIMGGEREYASSNIFATDCLASIYNGVQDVTTPSETTMSFASMNCASGMNGRGVVCKR